MDITPKKEHIEAMFNDIAPTYDKLNHILSLGVDKIWRRKAVNRLIKKRPQVILDIACGTGDSSIAIVKACRKYGIPKVTGLDLSEGMLRVARQKVMRQGFDTINFQQADALHLPFEEESVDAVFIAFGIRNFEERPGTLREIRRVLRPGGRLVIVELSVPQPKLVRALYNLYFLHLLPFIGRVISGNKSAYHYLPESVLHFPKPTEFLETIRNCGFESVNHKALSLGLCRIFEGVK